MLERKIQKKMLINHFKSMVKSGLISATILVVVSVFLMPQIDAFIVVVNFLSGFFIGSMVPGIYLLGIKIFMKSEKIKKAPYYLFIIIHGLILVLITFFIYMIVGAVLFPKYLWLSSNIKIAIFMAFFIAFMFTADTVLKQFLGNCFVKDILIGKYHKPKEKHVIVIFIDMANSTSFAECLSHQVFYEVLNSFFSMIEKCSFLYHGEIYKYLGDGAIVVWDFDDENLKNSYLFIKDFDAELKSCGEIFHFKYDLEIDYTMGVHDGVVLVGELGQVKKELGYWGDTMNTVQRIQSLAKNNNVNIMTSHGYYEKLSLYTCVQDFEIEILENQAIKGKSKVMDVVCFKM